MNFRLVDKGWDTELSEAMKEDCAELRIICPFIKERVLQRLLNGRLALAAQVITRFNLQDFNEGVSDLSALDLLIAKGAQVRGVRNLHAKLYLFGRRRAILTSANLTDAGLSRNHEAGFVADDPSIVAHCLQYFDELWNHSGKNLQLPQLKKWEEMISKYRVSGEPPKRISILADFGTDVGIPRELEEHVETRSRIEQAFVKFFGEGHRRSARSERVIDEVIGSESHWACTFPKGKRPRSVKEGAVIYMARMVKDPNDIIVYGRAVGMKHCEGRDDATAEDINRRSWKEKWPHYIRVRRPVFIDGLLGDGVSLNELKAVLGKDAFASTQRNAKRGVGNINPDKAYQQQAAVELSPNGVAWLEKQLSKRFAKHGKLDRVKLESADLYWPPLARAY